MAIPVYGTVHLTALAGGGESVTLTTDPETYEVQWPNRRVRETVIGGVVTLQWRKRARDAIVHAQSGPTQLLNVAVVNAMDRNDLLLGATWRLQDFEANDFVVRIFKWDPVKAKNLPQLYEYTLDLEVVTMAVLRGGGAYTGG